MAYRKAHKTHLCIYVGIHTMADPIVGYGPNEPEREHHKKQQLNSNI